MRIPGAQELLAVCTRDADERPFARSTRLASLGWPNATIDADTPGQRSERLLQLWRALIGRRMPCVTECDACATLLDVELDVDELLAAASSREARTTIELEWQGAHLRLRAPTLAELDAASRVSGEDNEALTWLMQICCEEAVPPAEALMKFSAALEQADPLGHLVLGITCPTCSAVSEPIVDPSALLWQGLQEFAERVINEVHVLARAYGWSERDILGLPTARRRQYLALVNG